MRAISLFFLSIITVGASAQGVRKPRLVVNVVVSQLRYDDLVRYGDKFTEGGFNRFLREGMTFTESEYDHHAGRSGHPYHGGQSLGARSGECGVV